MAGHFVAPGKGLSGGRLAQLFGAIGGIVAVAVILAWFIRFRPVGRGSAVSPGPDSKTAANPEMVTGAPLPPAAFVAAVESAIGQEVVLLRLRTPSKVFKLEVPGRGK
jgi:hypothetical protein